MRHRVVLATDATFEVWRDQARTLFQAEIAPEDVDWSSTAEPGLLFDASPAFETNTIGQLRVPRQFVDRARQVALHRDFRRFALLYRILWRITHHEPKLLDLEVDADMVELQAMGKARIARSAQDEGLCPFQGGQGKQR